MQVMGSGQGTYNAANVSLNTVNAPYRDTVSVLKNGWAVIRFTVSFNILR